MKSNDSTELMIALDFSEPEIALKWMQNFKNKKVIFKIGLELFMACGPLFISERVKEGYRIFLDLKLYDIPNTVSKAVGVICDLGVEFLTIHLSGGEEMILRSQEKIIEKNSSLKLLGVSVLTSFSINDAIYHQLENLTITAKKTNIFGMVCSAVDLEKVKKIYPEVYTVTPGIRLDGEALGDQKRVVTPLDAKKNGASAIVMGRSIFNSLDPEKSIDQILTSLN